MGKSVLNSFFKFILLCGSALCFNACVSENSTVTVNENDPATTFSNEFKYNYILLRYLYIDQDKYLGEPEDYIDKIDPDVFDGYDIPWDYYDIYYMYSQMNDPYTYYVDPYHSAKSIRAISVSEQLMDAGFEWTFDESTGEFTVKSVTKNAPADKAGLKVGDRITAIEGIVPTNETTFERLSRSIEGDTVTYTVQRDSATIEIPIVLESYYSPTVELSFRDSIPIIKIMNFIPQSSNDSGSYGEFMEFLRETEQYKSTVIDLRNNGGGDGDQCFSMAQELLSKGDSAAGVISTYRDSVSNRQAFDTTFEINVKDGYAKDRYFVFLANGYSASCSEVFLLSVTQNKNYPIVGTTTYGKGIGQIFAQTPSYSLARITAMKVIDKDNNTYHKYGIEPDFNISNDELALTKAVELAKEMTYIRTAKYGSVNTGHFAKNAVTPDTMPGFYFLPKEFRKKF